jgi:hypothetical protein
MRGGRRVWRRRFGVTRGGVLDVDGPGLDVHVVAAWLGRVGEIEVSGEGNSAIR